LSLRAAVSSTDEAKRQIVGAMPDESSVYLA
jgi:hypothetical protein